MSLEDGHGSHLPILTTDGNTTVSPIRRPSPAFKDGNLLIKSPKVSGNNFLTHAWSFVSIRYHLYITDKHIRFSPPSAQANGGYTLI